MLNPAAPRDDKHSGILCKRMNQILSNAVPTEQGRLMLSQLADVAEMGLYALTLQAERPHCEFVNHTWSRWLGASIDQIMACDWLQSFHPDDRVRMQQLYLKVFLTGCAERTEYRLCRSPETLWISDGVVPLCDPLGRTIGVGGCAQDISLVKSAADQMQRMQLLQSLGSLMAGIAHEINSPLQYIGDNLRFLADAWGILSRHLSVLSEGLEQISRDGNPAVVRSVLERAADSARESNAAFVQQEFPHAVNQSLEGVQRLTELVGAMRDFSHLEERRQAPADLNRAVRSALTLLHNQFKCVCDVQTQLEPELPRVNCSIDEINRVLLNLLVNAAHSIAEKIEEGRFSRGLIRVGTQRQPNGVLITIEDNGTGISPEVQPHIFERFFTTKRHHPERKGTGQGLSMARQTIVDHHHGTLTFSTHPGEGTVFYVFLPFQLSGPKGGI